MAEVQGLVVPLIDASLHLRQKAMCSTNSQFKDSPHTEKTALTDCCGYKVNYITSILHACDSSDLFQTDKKIHKSFAFKLQVRIFSVVALVENILFYLYSGRYNTALWHIILN